MSVFDLIVLVILAALTLRGIWKGMISQIVSVVSFFVCWIVATRFGGLVAPTIPVEAPWNQVLAMAIVFCITLIALRFAHAALEKLIKHWRLEKLNKLLGGLLGFTKGLLICLIITFFAVMFSEISRAIVFTSKSGSHLVHLITRIGLFVPNDSYEFVHTQFAQFQDKVDEAVPGQAPDTLRLQDSEMVQQMLAQVQQTKMKTETSSLWTALAKWWNGTKTEETTDGTNEPRSSENGKEAADSGPLTATTYMPSQVNAYASVPQVAAPQPVIAANELFIQRPEQNVPSVPTTAPQSPPPLTALSPMFSENVSLPSATLVPLMELSIQSEQSLPAVPPVQYHVGSDLLLHNSGQPTNSTTSAGVFRPR